MPDPVHPAPPPSDAAGAAAPRERGDPPSLPPPGGAAHVAALAATGLFLAGPYLEAHPDLLEAGVEPIEHYCSHGWREGRVANPWFDAPHYAAEVAARLAAPRPAGAAEDAAAAALAGAGRPGTDCDPLLHYARLGVRLGLSPNPYLDPAWYRATHLRGLPATTDPLLHFLREGEAADLRPSPWFDTAWYRAHHGLPAGRSPLSHLLVHRHDGRVSPLPEFDAARYVRLRRDLPALRQDPFQHYLRHGARERLDPSAAFETGFYADRYLRAEPGTNPLLHFLRHRDRPGVFPTRGAALREDVARLLRAGRRVVTLRLCWLDGVATEAETLRAFLADPELATGLLVIWGNERLAARRDVSRERRRALRLYHGDARSDADLCGFLSACLDDPRYLRDERGRRPLLLYAPGVEPGLTAAVGRWRALLPPDAAPTITSEWPDTA